MLCLLSFLCTFPAQLSWALYSMHQGDSKAIEVYLIWILFRHMPGHASREILVIMGSLTTCDPGNIHDTIQVTGLFSHTCILKKILDLTLSLPLTPPLSAIGLFCCCFSKVLLLLPSLQTRIFLCIF